MYQLNTFLLLKRRGTKDIFSPEYQRFKIHGWYHILYQQCVESTQLLSKIYRALQHSCRSHTTEEWLSCKLDDNWLPCIADCKKTCIWRIFSPVFETFAYFSSKQPTLYLITSKLDCPLLQQWADMCSPPWCLPVAKLCHILGFLTSNHEHTFTTKTIHAQDESCLSYTWMLCYDCWRDLVGKTHHTLKGENNWYYGHA